MWASRGGARVLGLVALALLRAPVTAGGTCSCDLDLTKVGHNNLGAKGPDPSDTEPTLVFKDVCSPGGDPVDLVIEVTGEYVTDDSYLNGKNSKGPYGTINLAKGKSVQLKATFKRGDEIVTVPDFFVSFFDLDLGGAHHTKVTVSGFDEFFLSKVSQVQHTMIAGGAEFKSPDAATPVDCPGDPMNLSPEQQSVAVTILFKDTSTFNFGLDVLGDEVPGHTHNFLIGGTTSMRTECTEIETEVEAADSAEPATEPSTTKPPTTEPPTTEPPAPPPPPPPPAAEPPVAAAAVAESSSCTDMPGTLKTCGADGCKVLADGMTGRSCDDFCKKADRTCVNAWEEVNNDCAVKEDLSCDQVFPGTSDLICECSPGTSQSPDSTPPASADGTESVSTSIHTIIPPATGASDCSLLQDVKLVCGKNGCKVLAGEMMDKTCDSYCREADLACMRAAEEVDDDCTEKQELECAAAFADTSDLICQCAVRDLPKATTLSQDARLGDTTISVVDGQQFAQGDYIEVSVGDFWETQIVTAVGTGTGVQNTTTTIRRLQNGPLITLKWPLKNAYGRGSNVVKLVEEAVEVNAPMQGADITPLNVEAESVTCKDRLKWPDRDTDAEECGTCKFRVSLSNFRSCETYCSSFAQECFHAADVKSSGNGDRTSCSAKSVVSCRDDIASMDSGSEDMICGCRFSQGVVRECKHVDQWPSIDGDNDCGTCKHIVNFDGDYRSCGEYCHSFGQECFYAAEDKNGPGGDDGECEVLEDFACSTNMHALQVDSNDMICGCQHPQDDCPSFEEWPDKDGETTCGKCKHLVTMDHHETCESYCSSFGQRCFYAATDAEGPDSSVHANGCVAEEEVTCTDNMKLIQPNSNDMICGCANMETIGPTPAPTIAPPPPLPNTTCSDFSLWPDKDGEADCGLCKHLVTMDTYSSCEAYCESYQQECFFAAEDLNGPDGDTGLCQVKQEVPCRRDLKALQEDNSNDMICGCRDPQELPKRCKDFSVWPDRDGDVSCGVCKHLVLVEDYKTCNDYCESFDQRCFYAALDHDGPGGDQGQCRIERDVSCDTNMAALQVNSNDMICGCEHKEETCDDRDLWPDMDTHVNCGTCTHLVKMTEHTSCQAYCNSFGHMCFYAAQDEIGDDVTVHHDGCEVLVEVSCVEDMSHFMPSTNDMICGCSRKGTTASAITTPTPAVPQPQPGDGFGCKPFVKWPDKEGAANCGECKHRVEPANFKSCGTYCESFGQECFYSAVADAGGDDSCLVDSTVTCRTDLAALQMDSSDLICGCRNPQAPPKGCKDFSEWPDKDGNVDCGPCKHLVMVGQHASCDEYCQSFEQECFYAAEDKNGPGGDTGECAVLADVACTTNLAQMQVNSNDMICGCQNPPPECKDFSLWPDRDGDVVCGDCKHLVLLDNYKSCDSYCASFGQTCFYAAQDKVGADATVHADGCAVEVEVLCSDDHSGFPNTNDMICGCANPPAGQAIPAPTVQSVSAASVPATPASPTASAGAVPVLGTMTCKDFDEWPDKDGTGDCGVCRHLVKISTDLRSCEAYCESFLQECFFAAEDQNGASGDTGMCIVDKTFSCRDDMLAQQANSQDMICGCKDPVEPPKQCKDFSEWPGGDGKTVCGQCRHLVTLGDSTSCDGYCQSFQQECFYAAETSADTAECEVSQDVACDSAPSGSGDMICGCQIPHATCTDTAEWPDKDGEVTCGTCKALVTMTTHKTCQDYCASFQHACFYAAADAVGDDAVVHADGCSILREVTCEDDMSAFPDTNDMICGCTSEVAQAAQGAPALAAAAAATPAPAAQVVKLAARCEPQKWLDKYSETPAGCWDILLQEGGCSQRYFNHATGSDGNCGCVTELSADCTDVNSQDMSDQVVAIVEFTAAQASPMPALAAKASYDCSEDYRDWKKMWEPEKKTWCCQKERRGCEDGTGYEVAAGTQAAAAGGRFDCTSTELWSLAQVDYCCREQNLGCPTSTKAFDCSTKELWPLEKRMWCCTNEQLGCGAEDDGFDCSMGDEDPLKGWSDEKKEYCCQHETVGCGDAGSAIVDDGSYRCEFATMADWSSQKQEYCCLHQNLGCVEQAKFQSLRGVAAAMEPRQLLSLVLVAGCCAVATLVVSWRRSVLRLHSGHHPAYATVLMRAEEEALPPFEE